MTTQDKCPECCWEGKNPHRCGMCCKCRTPFTVPTEKESWRTEFYRTESEMIKITTEPIDFLEFVSNGGQIEINCNTDKLVDFIAEKIGEAYKEGGENALRAVFSGNAVELDGKFYKISHNDALRFLEAQDIGER